MGLDFKILIYPKNIKQKIQEITRLLRVQGLTCEKM